MTTSRKSENIETLRGIACILLVLYHVIGPLGGGLKFEIGSPYRILADSMTYIRMPLFTFISGYIYSIYKIKNNDFTSFVKNKSRRLLIPLLCVGIPISILQALGPGVNQDISLGDAFFSFIIPINHCWFIQAIFIIFITVGFLDLRGLISLPRPLYLLFIISSILFLTLNFNIDLFGINGAIYLLPFFLTGMICQSTKPTTSPQASTYALLTLIIIFLSLLYLSYSNRGVIVERRGILGLVVGCISCVTFLATNLKYKPMVWIGNYSYAIFLYHPIFAVLSRYALRKLGISNDSVFVGCGLISGLVGPIMLSRAVRNTRYLPILLLGETTNSKKVIPPEKSAHQK